MIEIGVVITVAIGLATIAQLSADRTNARYPLLVIDGFEASDVEREVKLKTVSAEVDACGSLVFRYLDDPRVASLEHRN